MGGSKIFKSSQISSGGTYKRNTCYCIETCLLSRVKQITSPGWMHETSARTWCTGKIQRDRVEREVGGGIGMGNTCKPMAVSFQCMTKSTTIKKKKKYLLLHVIAITAFFSSNLVPFSFCKKKKKRGLNQCKKSHP